MPLPDSSHPTYASPSSIFEEHPTTSTEHHPEHTGVLASQVTPPGLQEGPTMGSLFRAFKRRWIIAMMVGAMGATLVGALLWHIMPAPFAAQANIRVLGRPPAYVTGDDAYVEMNGLLRSQAGLLKGEMLGKAFEDPEVQMLATYQTHADDPWGWAEKAVSVKVREGEMNLPIQVEGDRPEDIAKIANKIAENYIIAMAERRDQRLKSLNHQKTKLVEQLRVKSRQVPAGVDSDKPNDSLIQAQELRQRAQQAINTLQAELAGYQAQLERLEQGDTFIAPKNVFDEALQNDPQLIEQSKELKVLLVEYNNLVRLLPLGASDPKARRKYREVEREQQRIQKRKAEIEKDVNAHARREQLKKIENEIVLRKAQLKQREEQEQSAQKTIQALTQGIGVGGVAAEATLIEEIGTIKENLRKISNEIHELEKEVQTTQGLAGRNDLRKMTEKDKTPRVKWAILSKANEPRSRDRKKQLMMTGVGSCGVFGLLVLVVAYLEFRTRKVTRTEDLVETIGLPAIGTIPRLPTKAQRVNVDSTVSANIHWQSRLTESIDAVRTLLLRVAGEGSKIVMITSAVEGEGKTSLASQLAASLARSWRKTILIDGDLRKPAAHKLFNLPMEPGFSELLRGEMELQDVIRPTSLSRLWLMPAGQWDSHAVQAMAQEGINGIFNQLRDEYEYIIVDSSPVLPVADTLLLSQQADTVMFSVLNGVSRLPLVYAAEQRLKSLDIPLLGGVLIGGSDGMGGLDIQYPRLSGS